MYESADGFSKGVELIRKKMPKIQETLANQKPVSPEEQAKLDALAVKNNTPITRRTMDDVLFDLNRVKDNCMQIYPDKDGREVMLNAPTAIRALELEGKHYGGFTDKVDVEVAVTGQLVLPDQYQSNEEWEKAAKTIDGDYKVINETTD